MKLVIFRVNSLDEAIASPANAHDFADWIRNHPDHFPDYEIDYEDYLDADNRIVIGIYFVQTENERSVCEYEYAEIGCHQSNIYYNPPVRNNRLPRITVVNYYL